MKDDLELKFILTHPESKLPIINNECNLTGDVGMDITSVEDVTIPAMGSATVNIGLKLAYITHGYWLKIESRSGLGFKLNLFAFGGIIDNGYRGEIGIKIFSFNSEPIVLPKGSRIAQFILNKMYMPKTTSVMVAEETDRGEKGFGESGI